MKQLDLQTEYVNDLICTTKNLTKLAADYNGRLNNVRKIIKECDNQIYDLLHLSEDLDDRDPVPHEYEQFGRKLSELRTRRRDAKKALYVLESNQRTISGLFPALQTADGSYTKPSPLGNPTYKSLRLRSPESLNFMAELDSLDPEGPIKVLPPQGYEPPKEEVSGLLGDSATHIEIDDPEEGVKTVFGLPPQVGKFDALNIPEEWFKENPVSADDKFDALTKIVNSAPMVDQVPVEELSSFGPMPYVTKKNGSFIVSVLGKGTLKKSTNFVTVLRFLINDYECKAVRFDEKTYKIFKVFATNYRNGKTKGTDAIQPMDFERLYSNIYF